MDSAEIARLILERFALHFDARGRLLTARQRPPGKLPQQRYDELGDLVIAYV